MKKKTEKWGTSVTGLNVPKKIQKDAIQQHNKHIKTRKHNFVQRIAYKYRPLKKASKTNSEIWGKNRKRSNSHPTTE